MGNMNKEEIAFSLCNEIYPMQGIFRVPHPYCCGERRLATPMAQSGSNEPLALSQSRARIARPQAQDVILFKLQKLSEDKRRT